MKGKKKRKDDWKQIKSGEVDAIIFEHQDYFRILFLLRKKKIQYIVDTKKDVKSVRNEYDLKRIESIKVKD